jgi:hypothetical protein
MGSIRIALSAGTPIAQSETTSTPDLVRKLPAAAEI